VHPTFRMQELEIIITSVSNHHPPTHQHVHYFTRQARGCGGATGRGCAGRSKVVRCLECALIGSAQAFVPSANRGRCIGDATVRGTVELVDGSRGGTTSSN
jgi:hypothetical protein